MKILVVEDEPTSLKLAHVVLAADGNSVTDASSAEAGLESIAAEKPDIIFLDLRLPGIYGLALARQLKQDPKTQDIHIIAITGHPSEFSREEALAAGCDAYLTKPVEVRMLPQLVRDAAVPGGEVPVRKSENVESPT